MSGVRFIARISVMRAEFSPGLAKFVLDRSRELDSDKVDVSDKSQVVRNALASQFRVVHLT